MSNESIIELPALSNADAWEDPIPLDELNTPDIPARLLPGIYQQFAAGLSDATETPESLAVMTVLGVISTTLAKNFKISPKEGWYEPINIYTLIALPPANNKSLVLNACTKPLIEWERQQAELLLPLIKQQCSERKIQEKIIEVLRAKSAKLEDKLEQQKLIDDIIERESNLIEISTLPILFANDITPEALATLIYEQHGQLAIFSDEGGILETLSGLYSNGNANIDILLKGIDGGDIRIHRKDKCIAVNPYLTIVLTVQPAIVQSIGNKQAYLGNGALERFLYVIPKSKLGFRTHDKPPLSSFVQQEYDKAIHSLLNAHFQSNSNSCKQPIILKLSPAAFKLWKDFQQLTEVQLRSDGKLATCLGWGGKICGFALRIAGLLHVAEFNHDLALIQEPTMANAVTLASLLTEHAVAAFNLMSIDQTTADAKEIYRWLKTRKQSTFTQSEITLAMRNRKLGKAERLQRALHLLKEHNLISSPIKFATRKPTTLYYLHPNLN